jgi:hypothetical protein
LLFLCFVWQLPVALEKFFAAAVAAAVSQSAAATAAVSSSDAATFFAATLVATGTSTTCSSLLLRVVIFRALRACYVICARLGFLLGTVEWKPAVVLLDQA